MSSAATGRPSTCRPCSRGLAHEVGMLAGRLADTLGPLPSVQRELAGGLDFLRGLHAAAVDSRPDAPSPRLVRLREGLALTDLELRLLVLAGMPEEHEGLASVLASLHPRGESRPTPGLAAKLLAPGAEERTRLRDALETGPLHAAGLVTLSGSGPFFDQSLVVDRAFWSTLQGRDTWPEALGLSHRDGVGLGLDAWLGGSAAPGVAALGRGDIVTFHLAPDTLDVAVDAAVAMTEAAGTRWVLLAPPAFTGGVARAVVAHATARGAVPVVVLPEAAKVEHGALAPLTLLPGPLVIVGHDEDALATDPRPVFRVPVPESAELDRVAMWRSLVPELEGHATALASCFRLPPGIAHSVAQDARTRATVGRRDIEVADVAGSLRGRVGTALSHGARMVHPQAGWDDLVLATEAKRQLEEAGDRLRHQALVLDRWRFLEGRRGARGVKVLLYGPPGTGKTMAAEALALRVGVDLLVVDLSQVVSKWVGETEKNLSSVFDAAEQAQTVLLFDEADALFAQRTDVGDARDRYANLETAYLLTRLERFEGLAVLSTNLKRNIDPAFLRRLDFVVELKLPNAAEREVIWEGHVPDGVPRAEDVCFGEVASRYPVAGGLIRNAAVGAAFLAAANGQALTRDHLSHSIRREYAKAGLAFPGPLPGTTEP